MMISVKMLNDQIKLVSEENTLLDMLLRFEKVLDDIDLYAYENWVIGEVLEGPDLSRHWVTVKLVYPYKKMPDPDGAKRLLSRKCLVKYMKSKMTRPVKLKSADDLELATLNDGRTIFKTKTVTEPVWVVEICMPRRYVDEFNTDIIQVGDDTLDNEALADGEELMVADVAQPGGII